MKKYNLNTRIIPITKSMTIYPDGYSGIEIVNKTPNALIILNGIIKIEEGETFSLMEEPYVKIEEIMNISYGERNEEPVTKNAYVLLKYYNETN